MYHCQGTKTDQHTDDCVMELIESGMTVGSCWLIYYLTS